ncbi:MAG: sigma-54 dependent transcriptional regulator [Gammaproteobacteria bacterium]|nr:sigma-54 dependent transcriptional regulator [Gammaproteobacteria bacterium]
MNAPQILVVDDEADIRTLIDEILSDEGYRVTTAADGAEARRSMSAGAPDLVLLDIWMPDVDGITLLNEWSRDGRPACPVVVMSGHGTVETAVEATRLGAADFVEKPLSLQKLLRTVERALETTGGTTPGPRHSLLPDSQGPLGKSRVISELREKARELAGYSVPVLLVGEAGSGRETVARYVHGVSSRSDAPFIKLVASSLPAENAATQLLGTSHDDSAEPGLFARAGGGVLFVRDLQDLCHEAQGLLAGVLEQNSYTPVGQATPVPLDCRVLASISPNARRDPQPAGLRSDLLAHLERTELQVPALRDYPEDISELLRQSVDRLVETEGLPYRRFGVPAQNRLRNYPWPGNVEELRRLVRRMLSAGGSETIGLPELEVALGETAAGGEEPLVKQDLLSLPLREAREAFERAYLTEQLKLSEGKVGQLAKRVGMERTHLYRKLRSLGVDFRQVGDD